MFDRVTVTLQGGKGGDGCLSFRKEKFIPHGGPDGGDGGNGGSVILIARAGLTDFSEIGRKRKLRAGNGAPGEGRKCRGRNGDDCEVQVPLGTIVINSEFGGIMKELNADGESLVIARGGKGGRGNTRFASSVNQVPYEYEEGTEGEELTVVLDLKMIADIGIMGFPNAGKSTLLQALTGAAPKVADYPFTTLDPNRGLLIFDDYEEALIADIPGIIENASQGAGLGNRFLKHVERTAILVHVISAEPFNDDGPAECYFKMREEIQAFNPAIGDKPEIIVLNKIDCVDSPDEFIAGLHEAGIADAMPVSALTGEGLPLLKEAIREQLDAAVLRPPVNDLPS